MAETVPMVRYALDLDGVEFTFGIHSGEVVVTLTDETNSATAELTTAELEFLSDIIGHVIYAARVRKEADG